MGRRKKHQDVVCGEAIAKLLLSRKSVVWSNNHCRKNLGTSIMKFERKSTVEGTEIYENMDFKTTDSEIRNPDGSIVFSAKDIEIPDAWSQVAADVLAQKYFRKAGVPKILKKVHEEGVPVFLQRSVEDKDALEKLDPDQRYSSETT